jgi:hypothetical protein
MVVTWERVTSRGDKSLQLVRAKVPGGWLVCIPGADRSQPTPVTFFPDPEFRWRSVESAPARARD